MWLCPNDNIVLNKINITLILCNSSMTIQASLTCFILELTKKCLKITKKNILYLQHCKDFFLMI